VIAVPQITLPIFPDGVVHLSPELAVAKRDGQVTYFNGSMPVFTHDEDDIRTFQMITSQFCVNGIVKLADVARVFGVTPISVKRSVKRYRELGPRGFYATKATRGPGVLTPEVINSAQELLDDGKTVPQVAEQLSLKADTVRKAVRDNRLRHQKKSPP
jgi:transposase-like protein